MKFRTFASPLDKKSMENHSIIRGRLAKLRFAMQAKGISACIIPSSDAHQSEYTAPHWKTRTYFSGFTGSAGTLVVTWQEAFLWTDSRYFLQAEEELKDTSILLQKAGLPEIPSIENWICTNLPGKSVGIDGSVFSIREVKSMQDIFRNKNISLVTDFDPLLQIWTDRPSIPSNQVFLHPEEFSGESAGVKIDKIRKSVAGEGCNSMLLCSLDEIAWTFNLRGSDVQCNPVAIAYALITPQESVIFIQQEKVSAEIREELFKNKIMIADYDRLPVYLSAQKGLTIRIDSGKTNQFIFDAIGRLSENKQLSYILKEGPSPVALLKTLKNETEIAGFRNAMKKDGLVMVRLLMWIEQSLASGRAFTEISVEDKLKELRSEQALYFGESFDAIVGYQEHGAIIHYHASEASNQQIRAEGMLLIDTGGQYFDGTTDITRTIATGEVTDRMKQDFTLVLKGHIGIATARFPKGTRGSQLDILARRFLWNEGLSYLHGTGHGIGHFLNVHEGPQNIRLEENPVCIEPGMVTSNEPGVYRAGMYGIRIENLVLAREEKETEFGSFYCFETLTLCPIDTKLILPEMLTQEEKEWLNSYHQTVYDRLSPHLSENEQTWLKNKTYEI